MNHEPEPDVRIADRQDLLRSRRRFIGSVVALVFLAVTLFAMGQAIRRVHQNERRIVLIERSRLLMDEQMRHWAEKGKQLAAYAPPAEPARLRNWAGDIENFFAHSLAVFVKSGDSLAWPRQMPPRPLLEKIGQYLAAPESGERLPFKTLGSLQVWRKVLEMDTARYNLWFVQDPLALRGWGVVYNADDDWYSYFRALASSGGNRSEFGGTISMLQNTYGLQPSDTRPYLIGVRAYHRDSLIFESPVVDTTQLSYGQDFKGGRRVQFFAPLRDVGRSTDRFILRFTWFVALFPLLMIVPTYGWYRQVLRLSRTGGRTEAN